MRPLLLPLLAAAVLVPLTASAATPTTVTQQAFGGAPLGKSKAFYKAHFGTPNRLEVLEGGYQRIVFTSLKLEVYFRRGYAGGVAILSWHQRFRTAEGVGPCTTLAKLESAYGHVMKPFRLGGKIEGYRVGKLFFARTGSRVGVVQLSGAGGPPFLALNALSCGTPGA